VDPARSRSAAREDSGNDPAADLAELVPALHDRVASCRAGVGDEEHTVDDRSEDEAGCDGQRDPVLQPFMQMS
jgi:hypothetical protein